MKTNYRVERHQKRGFDLYLNDRWVAEAIIAHTVSDVTCYTLRCFHVDPPSGSTDRLPLVTGEAQAQELLEKSFETSYQQLLETEDALRRLEQNIGSVRDGFVDYTLRSKMQMLQEEIKHRKHVMHPWLTVHQKPTFGSFDLSPEHFTFRHSDYQTDEKGLHDAHVLYYGERTGYVINVHGDIWLDPIYETHKHVHLPDATNDEASIRQHLSLVLTALQEQLNETYQKAVDLTDQHLAVERAKRQTVNGLHFDPTELRRYDQRLAEDRDYFHPLNRAYVQYKRKTEGTN